MALKEYLKILSWEYWTLKGNLKKVISKGLKILEW
jgi:hypothetical protein